MPVFTVAHLSGLGNSQRTRPTAHSAAAIWVVAYSAAAFVVEVAIRPELVGKSTRLQDWWRLV